MGGRGHGHLLEKHIIRKKTTGLLVTDSKIGEILFLPCISPVGAFAGILVSFKHFEHSLEINQYQKRHQQQTDFKMKQSIQIAKARNVYEVQQLLVIMFYL